MTTPYSTAREAIIENKIRYHCPVCKQSEINFLPLPDFYLVNSVRHGFKYINDGEMIDLKTYSCHRCGASDRERFYTFWLEQALSHHRLKKDARVIHFAPKATLSI